MEMEYEDQVEFCCTECFSIHPEVYSTSIEEDNEDGKYMSTIGLTSCCDVKGAQMVVEIDPKRLTLSTQDSDVSFRVYKDYFASEEVIARDVMEVLLDKYTTVHGRTNDLDKKDLHFLAEDKLEDLIHETLCDMFSLDKETLEDLGEESAQYWVVQLH